MLPVVRPSASLRRGRLHVAAHDGFMFIELLIVLGMMGVLASIVIVAINPTKHLCEAANAKRHFTVREFGNALNEYQIRTRMNAAGSLSPGEGNAKPVCRQSVVNDLSCINLDTLAPDYLQEIPMDPLETNANYSGYSVYRLPGGLDLVRSDHAEPCS